MVGLMSNTDTNKVLSAADIQNYAEAFRSASAAGNIAVVDKIVAASLNRAIADLADETWVVRGGALPSSWAR